MSTFDRGHLSKVNAICRCGLTIEGKPCHGSRHRIVLILLECRRSWDLSKVFRTLGPEGFVV